MSTTWRRRPTLVVLAVAAAAMAAALLLDRGRPSTEEARRAREVLAPGIAGRGVVSRIDITRRDGAAVTLERDGATGWRLGPPDGRRADGPLVEQLLGLLDFAQLERRVPGPLDEATLRTLGLDAPRARLRAGALALDVGGDDPAGKGVYVRRAGDRDAFVIERRLLELVDVAPEAWVSRRLLLVEDRDSARTLALEQPSSQPLTLERAPGGWRLQSGRADPEALDALLRALDAAPATVVLPRAASTASAPAAARLAIRRDGAVDATLAAATDPACAPAETVARADGARLCVPAAALAPLLRPAAAIVDRRLVPFSLDDITDVVLTRGEARLALARRDGAWRVVDPTADAGPAADAAVRRWLAALLALRSADTPARGPAARLTVAVGADRVTLDVADDGAITRLPAREPLAAPAALAPLLRLTARDLR
jgi:hypothetical protein